MEIMQHTSLLSRCGCINDNDLHEEDFSDLSEITNLNDPPNTTNKVEPVYVYAFSPLTGKEREVEDIWNTPPKADSNDRSGPKEIKFPPLTEQKNSKKNTLLSQHIKIERVECETLFRCSACSPALIANFLNTEVGRSLNSGTISGWRRGKGRQPPVDHEMYERAPQFSLKYLKFLYAQREGGSRYSKKRIKIKEEIEMVERAIISIFGYKHPPTI